MKLICVKSKDRNFIKNKEYEIHDGYLYTESDVSINNKPYTLVEDALEDLKMKGYEFKEKTLFDYGNRSSNHKTSTGMDLDSIFGDIFSFMGDIEKPKTTEDSRKEAEDMKNDLLSQILRGM